MLYQVTKKHNFLPEVDPLFFLSVFSISSMSVVYKLFLTLAHPLTYCLTRPSPLISGFTGLSTPSGQSLLKAPTSSIRYRGVTELSTKPQYNISFTHIIFLLVNLQMRPPSRCTAPAVVHSTMYFNVVNHWDNTNDSFFPKATRDPYYLEVGRTILENLNRYARVPCGFAAMKDVRTGSHEDR